MKRGSTICDNMGEFWQYHAEQIKPDRKSQESYDVICMWDIQLKTTNEQTRQKTKTHRHRQQYGGFQGKSCVRVVEGNGGQI